MKFLVVSGRSGSGKTTALHLLEDEGYTCIDNLPVNLVPALITEIKDTAPPSSKFAIGIDARNLNNDLSQLPELFAKSNIAQEEYETVFLDCSRPVLLKRFSETRRRHPLSNEHTGLAEAIDLEEAILRPVAEEANVTIDTSNLNLHELRTILKRLLVGNQSQGTAIMFQSFGYKYGTPVDADFVFDVRCLPNPYWEASLRSKSGLEQEVVDFLDAQPQVVEMYNDILTFVRKWAPQFQENNRSYLTVAIGCTGGWHRSVYLCEKLSIALKDTYPNVQSRHRQIPPK